MKIAKVHNADREPLYTTFLPSTKRERQATRARPSDPGGLLTKLTKLTKLVLDSCFCFFGLVDENTKQQALGAQARATAEGAEAAATDQMQQLQAEMGGSGEHSPPTAERMYENGCTNFRGCTRMYDFLVV
jgi:hypothetical protein